MRRGGGAWIGCWIGAIVCIIVVIVIAAVVDHRTIINTAATEGKEVGPDLLLFRVIVGMPLLIPSSRSRRCVQDVHNVDALALLIARTIVGTTSPTRQQ